MYPTIDLGFIQIDSYNLFTVLGGIAFLITTLIIFIKVEKINRQSIERLSLLGIIGLACVAIFAMFFDTLFHSIKEGKFTLGGVTWLGGIFGAIIVTIILLIFQTKDMELSAFEYFSLFMPGVVIGHAIGRIGCWFAGCCYGSVTDSVFGVSYPVNGVHEHRYPTQLYEAAFELLMFIFMIISYRKLKYHFTESYMIGYGIFRFLVEFLRGDDRGGVGLTISPSQLLCIIFFAVGVLLLLFRKGVIFKKLDERLKNDKIKAQEELIKKKQAKEEKTELTSEENARIKKKGTIETIILLGIIAVLAVISFIPIKYSSDAKINELLSKTLPQFICGIVFGWIVFKDEKLLFSKPTKWYLWLPCLLVALNNFQWIAYFTGKASYTFTGGNYWALFLLYCLGIGLFEEFLFRGVLFKYVAEYFGRSKKGFIKTFFISSIVFGVAHLLNLFMGAGLSSTLLQVAYSTLIGGLCAFILLKTKNILLCVITHSIYDCCGMALDTLGTGAVFDTGTIICMAVIGVIVGVWVLYSTFTVKENEVIELYDRMEVREIKKKTDEVKVEE